MSKCRERVKYWGQLLLLPVYGLSFLFPRNRKIWLFGSTFGRRFADNPRYAYLYMKQFHSDEINAIWISRNKNVVEFLKSNTYEAYYFRSLKGLWYCLRGGVYIYDNYSKDISFWLSGRAKKVNLWHGTATKKINQDNKFDYYRNPRNAWERIKTAPRRLSDEKKSHYVLATSKQMAPILTSAFGTTPEHTLVVGHPRNDIFMRADLIDIPSGIEAATIIRLKNNNSKGLKNIFYVPTFRESEGKFFDIINLDMMNEYLKERGFILCTKLHIKSKLKMRFEELNYSNIYSIDADVDPATILPYCDFMIADYSSIYLDYTFLERPAVAFPFDYEEYTSKSRECYFDYEDYMPERKVYNMVELMTAIDEIFINDECFEKRKKRRSFHFDNIDGCSSERLYKQIKRICKL